MPKHIGTVVALTLLACCHVSSARAESSMSADGVVLEVSQREAGLTILLVNNDSKRPEIEYPFELLYSSAKSGLEISFYPPGKFLEKDRRNLCPVIDLAPDQFPQKRRLLYGNVVGQKFSKEQLKELYCLDAKKYDMRVRFYYFAADGEQKHVDASETVDFSM